MDTKCNVDFSPSFIGWKAYKNIKKKAMEQEFSLSGLLISLSIAFFVVLLSAYFLSILHSAIENKQNTTKLMQEKVYYWEETVPMDFTEIS